MIELSLILGFVMAEDGTFMISAPSLLSRCSNIFLTVHNHIHHQPLHPNASTHLHHPKTYPIHPSAPDPPQTLIHQPTPKPPTPLVPPKPPTHHSAQQTRSRATPQYILHHRAALCPNALRMFHCFRPPRPTQAHISRWAQRSRALATQSIPCNASCATGWANVARR